MYAFAALLCVFGSLLPVSAIMGHGPANMPLRRAPAETKRNPVPHIDERWYNYGTNTVPRVVTYFAYFHLDQNTGPYTPLLPVLTDHSGITDVLLFVCDLHDNAPYLTVGGEAPTNTTFLGPLWSEVKQVQDGGINVLASFGGYGSNTFLLLEQNFTYYYPILHDFLHTYNLSGVDFDIEPSLNTLSTYASGQSILKLVQQIRSDFGPDFLISMAPVALDLTDDPAMFSGIDYTIFDQLAVDSQGNKIIDWYNAQFYSGFGDCNSTDLYVQIVQNGFDPSRVVMLCPADANDAQPWYPVGTVEQTASALAQNYSNFGGVGGYEYLYAGTSDNITRIQWYQDVASAVGN